jgi:hypothetical protein
MKFLLTSTTAASSKLDAPMTDAIFDSYMKFNEELSKAGVLIASEGLNPAGARARFEVKNGKRVLTDGPYTESKELVGGFYVIEAKSKEEAIQWALRCPVGMPSADVLELYQLTGENDLPPELVQRIEQIAPTWVKTFKK